MKRKEFIKQTVCGFAALATTGELSQTHQTPLPKRRRYKIDIEIYEARPDSWCHKKGDKFKYPEDWGKVCAWLRGSMNDFIRILEHGGTLSWKYEGTPYEKVIDPDGITTEYVRCPDPTANLVAKITRTLVS